MPGVDSRRTAALHVADGRLFYGGQPILLMGSGMEALEGGTAAIPGAGDLGAPHQSLQEWYRYIDLMAQSGINWLRLYCAAPRPWRAPLHPTGWSQGVWQSGLDYWGALRAVVWYAASQQVMVEYCLFDRCDLQMRWPQHPFNQANGGPLAEWGHFFDPTLEPRASIQRRYLQEVITQLGAAPNLCFDLCNELSPVNETTRAWATQMAACLRQELGWRGPLGISTPCHARDESLCLLPGFDVCLPHGGELHAPETYWEPGRLHDVILSCRARYGPRPVLVDEIAHRTTRRNFRDVDLRRERAAFWAAITAGGMTVRSCWQPFTPTPTLVATAALRRILGTLPWPQMAPADQLVLAPQGHAWVLATPPDGADPASPSATRGHGGLPPAPDEGPRPRCYAFLIYLPHAGVRHLRLALPPATYHLRWYRPADGRMLHSSTLHAASRATTLPVPPTRADVVCTLTVCQPVSLAGGSG